MPRMLDMDSFDIPGGGNFGFSGAKIATLGASTYTLVDVELDETGSVDSFKSNIEQMMVEVVEAAKLFPTAENILMRVTAFGSQHKNGIREIHGYLPLADIDLSLYKIDPNGMTPLYDAAYTSIGAMLTYANELQNQDYDVNGISIIITDGVNNDSVMTADSIRKLIDESRQGEKIQSLTTVLVGVVSNDNRIKQILKNFSNAVGFNQYIDMGSTSAKAFAKLTGFISKSISSTSSSINSGTSVLVNAPTF